jgi:hypothetical protein
MQTSAKRPPSTISEVEESIRQSLEGLRDIPFSEEVKVGLSFLLRPGYRPVIQLEEDGRKKRSNASASNWNPETGEIVIFFEKEEASQPGNFLHKHPIQEQPSHPDASALEADAEVTSLQIQQCCQALAEAEKAGRSFIALKWFRDDALPSHHYAWTADAESRQRVLAKAIEMGTVKTSKIPNPRNPQFPTTTVSLNRERPQSGVIPRFNPVPVRGEPVSYTIMRDRGSL